jgi:hypothetical protein
MLNEGAVLVILSAAPSYIDRLVLNVPEQLPGFDIQVKPIFRGSRECFFRWHQSDAARGL